MKTSAKIFSYNGQLHDRARPLTLKEVLRLRDGLGKSTFLKLNYSYKYKNIISNEKNLLVLN